MICTGFGHRRIYERIDGKLYGEVCRLIEEEGVNAFTVGESGEFDAVFTGVVNRAKIKYPDVKLILVLHRFTNRLNEQKDYYEEVYDDVAVLSELADCHYKSIITKRNMRMIDEAEYVILYVRRDYGGAHNAKKYAEKLGKKIISI